MKNTLKSLSTKNNSTARVVDGKLILSCPEALIPIVWQMELTEAKASALEVRETKNNSFMLTLKTMKGESVEIAPFATKAEAVDALMAAAKALENAHGKIRPLSVVSSDTVTMPAKKSKSGRWLAWLLGILMILVLLGVWGALAPRPATLSNNAANGQSGVSPQDQTGVPLSADDYLLKR